MRTRAEIETDINSIVLPTVPTQLQKLDSEIQLDIRELLLTNKALLEQLLAQST